MADADDRSRSPSTTQQRERWSPDRHDWLIYTSTNAVEHALRLWPRPQTARVAAIGRATARALRARGVDVDVTPPSGADSEALLATPAFIGVQGRRILILTGQGGRATLLRRAGVARRGCASSRSFTCAGPWCQHRSGSTELDRELAAPQVVVMATSVDVFEALLRATAAGAAAAAMGKVLLVPGERVAAAARAAGWQGPVVVADSAEDDVMVAAFDRLARRRSGRARVIGSSRSSSIDVPPSALSGSCRVQCLLRSNRWSPTTLLAERAAAPARCWSSSRRAPCSSRLMRTCVPAASTSDLELAQGRVAELQGMRVQLASQQAATANQLQASLAALRAELQGLRELPAQVDELSRSQAELRARTEAPQRAWVRAEALYLLELGEPATRPRGRLRTAIVAMETADARLATLKDPALAGVRTQLGKELAALRAAPLPDLPAVLLRVGAVEARVAMLPVTGDSGLRRPAHGCHGR